MTRDMRKAAQSELSGQIAKPAEPSIKSNIHRGLVFWRNEREALEILDLRTQRFGRAVEAFYGLAEGIRASIGGAK